jgi:hypothetical protein
MPGAHLLGRTYRRGRHLGRRRHNTFRSKTIQPSRRKAVTIASCMPGRSRWGAVSHRVRFALFFFTSCHEPPAKRAGRFAKLMPQTTSFATRKCLLGVSSMKKFFQGSTLSPEFSKGILHANRKSRITLVRHRRKIPKLTYIKSGLRNRLVTSLPV